MSSSTPLSTKQGHDPSGLDQLPWPVVLAIFVPIVLTILTGRLLRPLNVSLIAAFPAFYFLVYAVWNWLLIAIGYSVLHRRGKSWQDLGFANFSPKDQGIALVAVLIGIFIVFPLANGLAVLLGAGPLQTKGFALTNPLALAGAIVLPGLFVPFAEEMIFRGFLLNVLRARTNSPWAAGLLGGLAFVVIHIAFFGWGGMLIYVVLWTPLPVVLYLWRKSLYPTLTMHALNNLLAYVIIPLFLR